MGVTLAISTCGPQLEVALRPAPGAVPSVVRLAGLSPRSTLLLAAIDLLAEDAGCAPAAIERVVVSRGPGSFTGIRAGLATAAGLETATGSSPSAYDSLTVQAARCSHSGDGLGRAAGPARRGLRPGLPGRAAAPARGDRRHRDPRDRTAGGSRAVGGGGEPGPRRCRAAGAAARGGRGAARARPARRAVGPGRAAVRGGAADSRGWWPWLSRRQRCASASVRRRPPTCARSSAPSGAASRTRGRAITSRRSCSRRAASSGWPWIPRAACIAYLLRRLAVPRPARAEGGDAPAVPPAGARPRS